MKNLQLSNEAYAKVQKLLKQGGNSALVEAVEKELSSLPQKDFSGVDLQSADNGENHTQKDWIEYFNKEGKQMISSPDVYKLGQIASDELLKSLRKDFDDSWLVTSTRNIYNSNDLGTKVIHNYGSKFVKPAELQVVAPIYRREPLVKVLDTKEGISYLQALFNTENDSKKITQTLEHLANKKSSDIMLWTPTQEGRKDYSERAVWFFYDDDGFHVGGYDIYDYYVGHSRGVSVSRSPRSGHAKK